ncbi:hypothetical protein [Algoriphagus resistens]|uniref:hypothetical protein n=1 Tax=Algoriphagus resistens TaxID=1750590 RepID=UPI0007168E10|nr:hypothetical protein [Algoriphagus resistens]
MSPAYGLVNTRLHVKDAELALKDGLFANDYYTQSYEAMGLLAYDDFYEFGVKIGILENRVKRIIQEFSKPIKEIKPLLNRSYLREEMKGRYLKSYEERLSFLKRSYLKREPQK